MKKRISTPRKFRERVFDPTELLAARGVQALSTVVIAKRIGASHPTVRSVLAGLDNKVSTIFSVAEVLGCKVTIQIERMPEKPDDCQVA